MLRYPFDGLIGDILGILNDVVDDVRRRVEAESIGVSIQQFIPPRLYNKYNTMNYYAIVPEGNARGISLSLHHHQLDNPLKRGILRIHNAHEVNLTILGHERHIT